MLRRVWAATILLVTPYVCAQGNAAIKHSLAPHLFTALGTFEKVQDGWRCTSIGHPVASRIEPSLFRELQIGDVIGTIDGVEVGGTNAVGMLQLIRTVEFGLAGSVEATRAGNRLQWTASEGPQIIASQHSFRVFRSTLKSVQSGDVLTAIGASRFSGMMTQVENPLTTLVTVELKPGKVLHYARAGEAKEFAATEAAMVRLLDFDVDPTGQTAVDTTLHGLNTPDLKLNSLRGRWTLLHFWATWCKPCIRHLPDTRELSKQQGLMVAAIGFADTEDRLAEMGRTEKDLKIFAPSPELQREMAIIGIPFDVLLDPRGEPVLVVSGDMRGEGLKEIVMEYLQH